MRLTAVELHRVALPLVAPFRTSYGVEHAKEALLVHVRTDAGADGWGECVTSPEPRYSPEYIAGAAHVLRHHLVGPVAALAELRADAVGPALAHVVGHRMAKAALETAVLDAELRAAGTSLARHLGAVRDTVPAGVSVGIMDSVPALLDAVAGYLEQGYVRIKLKIEPGWDVQPVRAVRERFGDVALQVDANTAYSPADTRVLAALDAFELLLVEQPLAADDLLGHAALARVLRTPVCLDESVTSARAAAAAIRLGACGVVNIKPGRVGGFLEARRIHDVCAAHGVPVWCGGMLETGIGRAANLALAALPNCTLPGDTSASDRYFATDLTVPHVLCDGHLAVPAGPGVGIEPLPEVLAAHTIGRENLPLR